MEESCCSPHVAHIVVAAAHGPFLCVCSSYPQELLVFRYLFTFLWLVLSINTDSAIQAHIWVLGKYGKSRRDGQKLPGRDLGKLLRTASLLPDGGWQGPRQHPGGCLAGGEQPPSRNDMERG